MITGFNDDFNRTVASGWGTATSGQAWILGGGGAASQYNVAPSTATILPTAISDRFAYADRLTSDFDGTVQVALSAIPVTNLCTIGFITKRSAVPNYYVISMMVAVGGAISLRFSRVLSGGLVTLATVATGLTYVANTFYNLRGVVFWSNSLQAHVLQSKLWLTTATEPGGWMATTTDNGITQYLSGTGAGLHMRDESTVSGAITGRFRSFVVRTYGLPIPAGADTMCADPAVAYPKQTALESLADATDTVVTALDPLAALANLFPRARISLANVSWSGQLEMNFTTTEFNIGTQTNVGFDPTALYLPIGIWLVTLEVQMAEASVASFGQMTLNSTGAYNAFQNIQINEVESNSGGVGGTGHLSSLVVSTDPAGTVKATAQLVPNNGSLTYTIKYAAFSAMKISDYFA